MATPPLLASAKSAVWPAPAPAAARLLVVDDEPEIAELLAELLQAAGYEVVTAHSGAEALRLLPTSHFDAIVSDLRMPDIDGAALWREVLALEPRLAQRMLFVTGDTLGAGARGFLASTGCPSLDKPFRRAELLRSVALLSQAPLND